MAACRAAGAGLMSIALVMMLGGVQARAQEMTFRVDGQDRLAIVYGPAAGTSSPAPLVMAFHGFGDAARNFQFVDLHRAWPEAVVVYFDGLPRRGDLLGWQVERGEDGDRDLRLVDVALASLRQRFRIDDRRIYATGFSNGAMFTYLLWAERPQVFAAFGPVAGRVRPSIQPPMPRPLLHVAGTRDAVVAFADQEAAIAMAIRVNRAGETRTACGEGCTTYGAASAAPVMVAIHPGGHSYPPGTSARIVEFFKRHPRP